MKTKLLKKIRKRFSVYHYPKGTTLPVWDYITEKEVWLLFDNENQYGLYQHDTYDEAVNDMRIKIRNEWKSYSIKYKKQQSKIKKIWY